MARIFLIIGCLQKLKFAQIIFFCKVGSTLIETLNKPAKVCIILLKVCPSGEISPNMVTLEGRKKENIRHRKEDSRREREKEVC